MAGHLRQHSFTGNTDHDFTGLGSNYLPKLNSSGTGITNSQVYDNGTNVGIGTTSPSALLHIKPTGSSASNYSFRVEAQGGLLPYAFAISEESEVTINSQAVNNIVVGTPNNIFQTHQAGNYFQHLNNLLSFGDTTTKQIVGVNGTTFGAVGMYSNHDFRIRTNNLERVTVDTSGRVGIGTTTPTGSTLQVVDTLTADSNRKIISLIDSLGTENFSVTRNVFTTNVSREEHYSLAGTFNVGYYYGGSGSMFFKSSLYGSNILEIDVSSHPVFKSPQFGDFFFNGNIGIGMTTPSIIGEKLHISGGTIRIQTVNGTEGAGKLAVSDANGSISFSSTTALGLITSAGTVNKYTTSTTLTAGTVSYITHGLGLSDATDAVVQMWSGNNLTLGAEISAVTTNQIAVTTSVSGTYKIVVLG